MKKVVSLLLVLVMVFSLCGCMNTQKKGLFAASEIKEKLTESYGSVWGDAFGSAQSNPLIFEKIDEESFTGHISLSNDSTMYDVVGLIQDGQVVQIQSSFFGFVSEDEIDNLGSDGARGLMGLATFPICIFEQDVHTLNDCLAFISDMELIESDARTTKYQLVRGDIEYTYSIGANSELISSMITIRYLPAFSCGYLDE